MTIALINSFHRSSGSAVSTPGTPGRPIVEAGGTLSAEISPCDAADLPGRWPVTGNGDLISRNLTVAIGDLLDARTIEPARVADALDALRCAVLLTDAQGTILHVNRA